MFVVPGAARVATKVVLHRNPDVAGGFVGCFQLRWTSEIVTILYMKWPSRHARRRGKAIGTSHKTATELKLKGRDNL